MGNLNHKEIIMNIVKRFLILAALIGGTLLASLPGDAMARGPNWYARHGYYPSYYGGYYVGYGRPRYYYRRPGVVVQAPGVYVGPAYSNVWYGW
jgi:hypothetical protein